MIKLGWAIVALLFGLAVGWWAGSFTTACAPAACQANVDAIEAAGTWVGGLGTVAAVLFAARVFTSEERARRDEQETRILQMQQEQDAKLEARLAAEREMNRVRAEANLIVGAVSRDVSDPVQVRSIRVTASNHANETAAFKVNAELPGYGALAMAHKVESGATESLGVFGDQFGVPTGDMFGLKTEHLPRAIPGNEREKFYADLTSTLVVTYEMNGRRWRRRGDGPVELLS